MSLVLRLALALLALSALGLPAERALAAPPGTQYPSQKIVFTDPLTGRTVWRMTTDGAQRGAFQQAPGDQSSESRSFSPDSTRIVYSKSGISSIKPDGVYMMDILSGVETFLAPSVWYASPIFARDGSDEVYFYDRPAGGSLLVRAVNTRTFAARTIATLTGASWQEKIEVNVDGSYISAHPRMADGNYRTVVFTPSGTIHPNWTLNGPPSDDGAVWSPADPSLVCAVRNGQARFWNVDTLATRALGCVPAHSAWHPNGDWFFTPAYLGDIDTGANVLPGTGMGPIHPNFNPTEGALGTGAHITADDRHWFNDGPARPRLYTPTVQQLMAGAVAGNWRVGLAGVHYSTMDNNSGHIHAHWSFDGRYLMWTSDTADLSDGTPPGGTNGLDLFILPTGASGGTPPPPSSTPALAVSPTAMTFAAVQGGPAPAPQALAIANTGGGTLTWMVTDSAAWLAVSAAAGSGNATLSVTASPAGLAAGTYTGSITVAASGATGSPKTVAVTLSVSAAPASGKDLVIEGLALSPASVAPGGAVTVSYRVVNRGTVTVTERYMERVYLSADATLGAGDALLGASHTHTVQLAPGASHASSVTVTIPAGAPPGQYFVLVQADALGAVAESNESNNVSAAALTVTGTTSGGSGTTTTVTFDNPAPAGTSGSLLSGTFQGIDFGSGRWRWEGPFSADATNHVYFDSSTGTSRSFRFAAGPRYLRGMRVFSTTAGTLTLKDDLGQTRTQSVAAGSMQALTTGWTQRSTTVTVTFTSGWDLGVDDITMQ